MNDLIKFKDGKLAQQTINYITAIETQMKILKDQYDAFKDDLKEAMEQNGLIKVECDNIKINYIAESTRETFDSKAFKSDMPELYNEYVKFSKVKASVRIKVE